MAFGGGLRLCVGADFAKLQIAVFLHCLVTKYRYNYVLLYEVLVNTTTRTIGCVAGSCISRSPLEDTPLQGKINLNIQIVVYSWACLP